jgi:hypothetical protein
MKTTADKKNTEVKVQLNGGNPFVIIIPVDKSGYQSLQSVKTKQSSAIELACVKGEMDKVEELIGKITSKYEELVRPALQEAFGDIPLRYTEANTLMTFQKGEEVYQAYFELNTEERPAGEELVVTKKK